MFCLIEKEWKELNNKRKFFVITLIVSIIAIIGTSYISFNNYESQIKAPITIGICDYDNSFYSNMLIDYFESDNNFSNYALLKEGTKEQLELWLNKGNIDAYLILPENFADNLIRLEHTPIEVKISTENSTSAIILKNVFKSYEQYIEAVEVNAAGLYELMKQEGFQKEVLNETNRKVSIDLVFTALGRDSIFDYVEIDRLKFTNLISYYWISILSIVILFVGMLPAMYLLKEKENQVIRRIKISNIGLIRYIISKWVIYSFLFSILINLIYIIGSHFIGDSLSFSHIMCINVSSAFSVALSIMISILCNNRITFLMIGNISYLLFCILGGTIIPITYLPDNIYKIAKLTPNFWFIRYMLSI